MDPVAFSIGPLVFRWYGLLIVGGALFAAWVASKEAVWRGQDPDHVWDVFVWALLGGILGARLYHVFSNPADTQTGAYYYFVQNPLTTISLFGLELPFPRALAIWEGGLGIYGAILGGALVVWLYTRRHHLYLPTWLDIGSIGLVTGQIIGRWGNFFNQELYGKPTTLPWGISIDLDRRLAQYASLPADTRFHPAFLYESLWSAMVLGVLLWISRRYPERLRPGDIFSLYLVLYGIGRFLVEFQRPDAWRFAGLPAAQWFGMGIALLGMFLIWRRRQRPQEVPYLEGRETRGQRKARLRAERKVQG